MANTNQWMFQSKDEKKRGKGKYTITKQEIKDNLHSLKSKYFRTKFNQRFKALAFPCCIHVQLINNVEFQRESMSLESIKTGILNRKPSKKSNC